MQTNYSKEIVRDLDKFSIRRERINNAAMSIALIVFLIVAFIGLIALQ